MKVDVVLSGGRMQAGRRADLVPRRQADAGQILHGLQPLQNLKLSHSQQRKKSVREGRRRRAGDARSCAGLSCCSTGPGVQLLSLGPAAAGAVAHSHLAEMVDLG